jgi:hypothetical protein
MNLLALAVLTMTLTNPCDRGCQPNIPCYRLLVSYMEDPGPSALLPPPPMIERRVYIGEPYSTRTQGVCGAQYLRQTGICIPPVVGAPGDFVNYAPVTISIVRLDGTEPDFPGFDDCEAVGDPTLK